MSFLSGKIKLFTALFVFFIALLPLFATEGETTEAVSLPLSSLTESTGRENVSLGLNDLSADESMHYSFLYGYQAMLQDLCNGALLTFDKNDNYVTGYLTPSAPDDFCTRISAKTIAVAEPVTSETMTAMYTLFGDRFSLSTLMARDDKAYVAVIMFEPVDDMVLTPMWYAETERKIKNESIARGINPDDVYSLQNEVNGLDKDTLVALAANGEISIGTIVADAVSMQKEKVKQENTSPLEKSGVDSNFIIQFVVLGLIIFIVLMFGCLVIRFFTKDSNAENSEDEDEDVDEEEATETGINSEGETKENV